MNDSERIITFHKKVGQPLFLLSVPTVQTVCLLFAFVLLFHVRSLFSQSSGCKAAVWSTEFPFRAHAITISVLYNRVSVHRNRFLFNNQPDALIILILSKEDVPT